MSHFTNRAFVPEHLDDPEVDPAILARSLRFIRTVNARLGGTGAMLGHLRCWTRTWPSDEPLRVLDLGTGSADIPLAIVRWGRRRGLRVQVTGVDNHTRTLEFARQFLRDAGEPPESPTGDIVLLEADVRQLMDRFKPASFDIVHAGMFLHHLPDVEIVTVLRIMQRLARIGLIWNDLTRDIVSAAAIRVLTLGLPAMVRHDAIVSVAKGFTRREVMDLAQRAGLGGVSSRRGVRYHRHLCGRFTLAARWGPSPRGP